MGRIEEIQARHKKATGDAWISINGQIFLRLGTGDMLKIGGGFDIRDAEFVAHAREDIPWLLAENARLEAERDGAKETIRKVEDRLKTILGATEYVKPGTGIYMTTKLALECIKEWRGAQPATGAEGIHETS